MWHDKKMFPSTTSNTTSLDSRIKFVTGRSNPSDWCNFYMFYSKICLHFNFISLLSMAFKYIYEGWTIIHYYFVIKVQNSEFKAGVWEKWTNSIHMSRVVRYC